jgi:hypothetical protein
MREQIVFFKTPGLHHRSPDSGELQYKSRELNMSIWVHCEGWWWSDNAREALERLQENLADFKEKKIWETISLKGKAIRTPLPSSAPE